MHISLFNKFAAKNSPPIWKAIETGLQNLQIHYDFHNTNADVAFIWSILWSGNMRNNKDVYYQFHNTNRPVIIVEVGSLKRGYTWKLGINGINRGSYPITNLNSNRPNILGIKLHDWEIKGDDIIICLQNTKSKQWEGKPPMLEWLTQTIDELRKYTDRNIIVRQHPRDKITIPTTFKVQQPTLVANTYDTYNFVSSLKTAYAVINCSSSPGIEAVLNGIPAFVEPESLAAPVANLSLANINSPTLPNRSEWLVELCHAEWTCDEIATGYPLKRLFDMLQSN